MNSNSENDKIYMSRRTKYIAFYSRIMAITHSADSTLA
jgi:hypothetical protein